MVHVVRCVRLSVRCTLGGRNSDEGPFVSMQATEGSRGWSGWRDSPVPRVLRGCKALPARPALPVIPVVQERWYRTAS